MSSSTFKFFNKWRAMFEVFNYAQVKRDIYFFTITLWQLWLLVYNRTQNGQTRYWQYSGHSNLLLIIIINLLFLDVSYRIMFWVFWWNRFCRLAVEGVFWKQRVKQVCPILVIGRRRYFGKSWDQKGLFNARFLTDFSLWVKRGLGATAVTQKCFRIKFALFFSGRLLFCHLLFQRQND